MFKKVITKLITKAYAPELTLCFTNEGSTYDEADSKIYLDFHEEKDSEAFFTDLQKHHSAPNASKISPILWSLLHELGHYNNDDTLTEYQLDFDEVGRYLITIGFAEPEYYYRLPKEFEATEWAISEIRKHYIIYRLLSFLLKV